MIPHKITWTEKTWNPITGCHKISAGCQNCYAEKMSHRLKAMGQKKYANGFNNIICHPKSLNEPYKYKSPKMIFVCSMSDIFNPFVPESFIDKIMQVIADTPQHTYQILTKRPEVMAYYFKTHDIPKNLWVGVTVENKETTYRIDAIRNIPATVRFISAEPLLDDLGTLDLTNIDWVIIGGETGTNARPMHPDWVQHLVEQCTANHIPMFFKQWGTYGIDGKRISKLLSKQFPNLYARPLCYRDFPKVSGVKTC